MTPYTAAHVANYFLDQAKTEGRSVDMLKLQQLVYIGYGWVLALLNRKLFDEPIEAWKHGPVIPSLYHEFKHYRWEPIEEYALTIDWDEKSFIELRIPPQDEKTRSVLSVVWDAYKKFTGWDLREKTHEEGTPWQITYKEHHQNQPIPEDLIRQYFLKKIRGYVNVLEATDVMGVGR